MSFFKNKLKSTTLVCFFILLHVLGKAQVQYVTDSSYIKTLANSDKNNCESFKNSGSDSTINNFQNYYPRNTSGNLGLPSAPLLMNYEVRSLGFKMYHAPYDLDMISESKVTFYQTKGPYASLTGIAGSKQEQLFRMLFTHTFKNRMNITLAFNRYGAIGFYKKQQSFTNNFYTTTNYTSKGGRAGYYAYFLFNKVKHQENGGIKNDSLFLVSVRVNKQLLPVNLNDARREVRYTDAELNPWLRLNKTEDSSTIFSHYIDYTIHYSGNYTKYLDRGIAADGFYQNTYLDTALTLDSTHWRSISNGGKYTLKINPLNTRLQIGVKNEYTLVHQYRDSTIINNSVNAGIFYNTNSINAYAKADFIYQGSNQNDYSLDLGAKYYLNTTRASDSLKKRPTFVLNVNVNAEKRHPDFIYNTWYSNHIRWNNNFSPTDKLQGRFSISTANNRFDVGVLAQNISNQVYFNNLALPFQTPVSIQNLSLFIKKDFLLWRHLGINAGYINQSTSNEAIVSVPKHVINGALYYQGNLFKKALQLQIGFSGQYFSSFYGYNYMPATNAYYVQTNITVGNYPYIDFFLNARIKPVRIFVKIDHVAQGFLGRNYSLSPGYLQNDRAFRFGLNWVFFD